MTPIASPLPSPAATEAPSNEASVLTRTARRSRTLNIALPAFVAGAAAGGVAQRPLAAVITLGLMLVLARGLWLEREILRLMPFARVVCWGLIPVIAVGAAMLTHSGPTPLEAGLVLCVAWMTQFVGARFDRHAERRRPVRIAVLGSPSRARALADELDQDDIGAYEVVGHVPVAPTDGRLPGVPRLGRLSDLRTVVLEHDVDLLVLASETPRMPVFDQVAESCLDLPVRLVTAESLYEMVLGHVPIGAINTAWFQSILHPRFSPSSSFSKRLLDIVVSGTALLVMLPVFVLVALAVKLSDGGSVFYRQTRVGEAGQEFEILKFRSMTENAEAETGPVWASSATDRVTRIGGLLRRSHLDELPQLVNVLRGDMSLVGPRPERPEFIASLMQSVPFYARRGLVKPGITGWAQIRCGYAGSEAGTAWKICHDLFYVRHRTTFFDLLVLTDTVRTFVADRQYEVEAPVGEFVLRAPAEIEYREPVAVAS